MAIRNILYAGLGAAAVATASTPSSSSLTTNKDTPLPPAQDSYAGPLRPQVHFSPPAGFMNDPNGMFYDPATKTWHLYYQYNPSAITAGNQHWGHATSRDLYSWTNQPIALSPPNNSTFVFSGSAVLDPENTSGFFSSSSSEGDGGANVVAIFTLAQYNEDGSAGPQDQNIAFSRDGGFTFEWFDEGNPVIPSGGSDSFRDPKVFLHEGKWVMVVARANDRIISIYDSSDLRSWEWRSDFGPRGGLTAEGVQWECPNLIRMPVVVEGGNGEEEGGKKDVLFVSVNPGAPLGGSATQYFVGTFNGTHFIEDEDDGDISEGEGYRLTDFAMDNYAAQWFYGGPEGDAGRPVNLGWASNWEYTEEAPTGEREGWRSAMTVPRENYLVSDDKGGLTLAHRVYGLEKVVMGKTPLNSNHTAIAAPAGVVEVDYSSVASKAVSVEIEVTGLDTSVLPESSAKVALSFWSADKEQSVESSFDLGGADNRFWLDRSNTQGLQDNESFTSKFNTTDSYYTPAKEGQQGEQVSWNMRAAMDRSLLEVFLRDGLQSGTLSFFPEQGSALTQVKVEATDLPDGSQVKVGIWGLQGGWESEKE